MEKSITVKNGQVVTAKVTDPVIKLTGNTLSVETQTITMSATDVPTTPDPPPVTTPGLTGPGTIVNYTKFDTLNPEQLGRGKIIADPVNPVNNVFSALVNKGDSQISGGWRSEQNWPQTPNEGGVEFDAYFIAVNPASLMLQIHGNTQGTGGPVSIQFAGTNKLKVVLSDEKMNNTYLDIPGFTFQLKKWYHFRVEFLLANPGYFKVIIDGVTVSDDARGKKVNDVTGQYGKLGINMFNNSVTSNILYDNFYIFKK